MQIYRKEAAGNQPPLLYIDATRAVVFTNQKLK